MNTIGKKIADLMQEKDISYRDLSKKTGIGKSALQRYVTGETEKIPIPRVEAIAKALNVTAAYLLGWEDKPSEEDMIQDKLYGQYRILFDLTKKVKPEDLEMVKQFLERLTQDE